MNKGVNLWTSVATISLSCCLEQLNVPSVQVLYFGMQSLDHILGKLVGADGDAKIVCGSLEDCAQSLLNIVVNLVHAKIQVLELGVLDRHPLLDLFTSFIFTSDLLNIVKLRHWLFGLLGGLELLVLLNDGVSLLELSELVLNLILWEWESPDHLKQRGDHI